MTHTIKVNSVSCEACINTIKKELEKIDNVKHVNFNKASLSVKMEKQYYKKHSYENLK